MPDRPDRAVPRGGTRRDRGDLRRRRWHLTLIVPPAAIVLSVPLTNRWEPRLLGLPLFYWGQVLAVLASMLLTGAVLVLTRERSPWR